MGWTPGKRLSLLNRAFHTYDLNVLHCEAGMGVIHHSHHCVEPSGLMNSSLSVPKVLQGSS
uniref:Uncharacterized protein n=2 Tax=Anguilla anguilla TaxID=7936 RepID=A0A0E9R8T8_ANGAN